MNLNNAHFACIVSHEIVQNQNLTLEENQFPTTDFSSHNIHTTREFIWCAVSVFVVVLF